MVVHKLSLSDHVVVVAGSTHGAGRGIATAFGECGATVICTGRSSRTAALRSDYQRSETVEETAEMVTALGGTGVAIPVDHLDREKVASLAERLGTDYGHIDVLVNDIWGGEDLTGHPDKWNVPIWEKDLDDGLRMLRLAIDTHLITSHHLLPLMVERPGGLLVEVTDGTLAYNADHYRISVFYDLVKVSINRLAFSQGHELAAHGCTAVAVTPGWLRSEMMLEGFGVAEANWRDSIDPSRPGGPTAPPGFANSESPRYVGRCIAAIAGDPDRARWNQQSIDSGSLAKVYGVRDLDGTQPDVWSTM